ncbi:M28 family peptidase [Acidobacteriota bacterium]
MTNSIIKSAFAIVFVFLLAYCAGTVKEPTVSEEERDKIQRTMDSISSDVLLNYVKKLSSEDYAGRLSGMPEYKACASWIASLFKQWGLKPGGDHNTYLQSYPNPYTTIFVGGELSYSYKSKDRWRKKKYVYEKDYYPGSQSGNGKRTAEVIYVGYGITAPELSYDDYEGVNVKGKIVLVEPGVPVAPEEDPQLYKEWRPYSPSQYKIKMAVAHGAKGMLINELTVNPSIDYVPGFMVAQVGDTVIKDIFSGTEKTRDQIIAKIKGTFQPQSFRTKKTFTIENFTEHNKNGTGYNVLGLIEGSDPLIKSEVIILGANLDHCGFCYEVIPGANDNASGMAVLLSVAEALIKNPVKPKRSILIIGFGSKEQALKGSQTYLKNPLFPKNKTVVFLNLDMVGCGNKLKAFAASNYPELWPFISQANSKTAKASLDPLPYSPISQPQYDADLFLTKKIPSIIFSAYGAPTYPRSTKDTPQTLTPQIMEDLGRILLQAIYDLANTDFDFFTPK